MPSKVYHSKSKNTPTGERAYRESMGDVPSPLPPATGVTLEEHPAFAGAKPKDDPMAWLDEAKAKATAGQAPKPKVPKPVQRLPLRYITIAGRVFSIHWKTSRGVSKWGLSSEASMRVIWLGNVNDFISFCHTMILLLEGELPEPKWQTVDPDPQYELEPKVIHILPKAEPKPQKVAATVDHTVRAWLTLGGQEVELQDTRWIGNTLHGRHPGKDEETSYPPMDVCNLLDRGTVRIEGYMPPFYQRRKPVDVPAMMAEIKRAFNDEEPIARTLSEDGYELRVKSKFVDLVVFRNGRAFTAMVGSTITGVANDGTLEGAIRKVAA